MASATAVLSFVADPYSSVYLELAHVIAMMYFHPFLAVGNPSITSMSNSEFGSLYLNVVFVPPNGSFLRFAR